MPKDIYKNLKPRAMYIKWRDHYSMHDGWSRLDYSSVRETGYDCETVGWLVAENKGSYILCLNICKKNEEVTDAADSMVILKATILKKRFLNLK